MGHQKKQFNYDILILLSILITVATLWYLSWQWIDINILSEVSEKTNQEVQGLFGNKFGAINSLFSALAFAAIIFTVILQNREINNTKKAMEKQNETTNSQRFDSTFFS